jgi:hypothetical protein
LGSEIRDQCRQSHKNEKCPAMGGSSCHSSELKAQ